MTSHRIAISCLVVALGSLVGCSSDGDEAASGTPTAGASVADFADAICRATREFDEAHPELNQSLGNAEPGSEEYRANVIAYLGGVRDIVASYSEVNDTVRIDGSDAEGFQKHFGEEMAAAADRAQEYIDALETAEAPVVDLTEVLDDVGMNVNYDAWVTGRAVREEMRNCDLG